ncbi:hypothetical protein BCD67_21880 [Oscillatoriales cyanobacterium USR001]|nr:hypothetical protein BCD67_21880 [Oscillatoriales cyanobacterium USR001]
MPNELPEILTPEQVAEYLQIELDEVINLLSSGKMPGNKIVGKWRIRKSKLDEWIDAGEINEIEPGNIDTIANQTKIDRNESETSSIVKLETQTSVTSNNLEDEKILNTHKNTNVTTESKQTDSQSSIQDQSLFLLEPPKRDNSIIYELKKNKRIKGSIKKFDPKQGYGFITAEDGRNVYLSAMDVEGFGQSLRQKEQVEFEIISVPQGWAAKEVKVLSSKKGISLSTGSDNHVRRPVMSYKSEELYQAALAAKEQKDIARARKLFEEAISISPSLNIFQAYAAMEENNSRIENALRVLERGIQEFPEVGPLYDNYGMLLRRRKDFDGAAEILRKGIKAAPSFAKQLHWSLARVLVEMDDNHSLQEAATNAEKAKELGMPLQDDPYYKKLRLFNGPAIGRKAFDFFRDAGFDIKVKSFTNEYADILITTQQVEYAESYDLKGWLLARCFFKKIESRNKIDNLIEFIRKERVINTDICFLILDDVTPWRDTLYRIMEDSREAIVPIDNNTFSQLDKGEDITGTFRQVLDQWLSRRDLFDYIFPVQGRRFFGRETELQNIMRSIDEGQHIGIYGLRKVGKTSLLYKLKEKRPQDLVVYIDLENISGKVSDDCAYLYWAISRGLHESLSEKKELGLDQNQIKLKLGSKAAYSALDKPEKRNALHFSEDINRLLDALSKSEITAYSKIVITIDELEYMLPIPGYNNGFSGYADFFANLRGIAQRTQGKLVSVITAANPQVSEQTTWEGRDNPVFQFYKDTFLPPLAKEECYEMIEKLGRGMGVSFDPDSLDAIYKETGGHPSITRVLCSYIVHQTTSRPLQVSCDLVIKNIETFLRDKGDIFREILKRLEDHFPQELDLLKFIAEGLSEESELGSLVTIPIDVALRHLIGYQMVDYQDGKYKIKINLLHRWLKRYHLGSQGD